MKSQMGFRLAVVSFCVLLCGVLTAQAAQYTLTDRFESIDVLDGQYRVHNNVWGATTSQNVMGDTDTTAFEVTLSNHNSNSVAAYPFILKGTHWGSTPTVDSGLPVLVDDVVSAPFSWSIDTSNTDGNWNAAFESFFSSTGGTAPPDKAELMIWIDYQGPYTPGGTNITTLNIGGLDWKLYHGSPWHSWEHYIAYQLVTPTDSVNLNLKDFMDDSLARGYLDPSWYMDNMEAGFEIWSDGEGLKTTSFAAAVIVPEPSAFLLAAIGLLGLLGWGRRRRR